MRKTETNIQARMRRLLLAVTLPLLTVVTGCVNEEGECSVAEPRDMSVNMKIHGGLPASTRALDEDWGTTAESYINIDDLYVLAFEHADGQKVAGDGSTLKDIIWSPVEAQRLKESVISSNGTEVWLRTFLSSDDYNTTDNFSLVVISNTAKWLSPDNGFTLQKGVTTLADLQKTLSYPEGSAWTPDNEKSSGIPLFGVKRVNLSNYNSKLNNSANPYPLGTVWLLRTLAKIELSTDPASGLEIESAYVTAGGWNSTLQLIPSPLTNMENYTTSGETGQVSTAPTFSDWVKTGTTQLNFSPSTDKDGKPIFVAYLPEYQLVFADGTSRNNIVRVKFLGKDSEFRLAVAPYSSGLPTASTEPYWQYLLRNYLYRFQVNGIQEDASLSLNWTVCPMDNVSVDIEFN